MSDCSHSDADELPDEWIAVMKRIADVTGTSDELATALKRLTNSTDTAAGALATALKRLTNSTDTAAGAFVSLGEVIAEVLARPGWKPLELLGYDYRREEARRRLQAWSDTRRPKRLQRQKGESDD